MMIGFGGCQTVIDETFPVEDPVTFSARIETLDGPTKTTMTDDRQVVWSEGDQIAIFYGDNVADIYQIADNCANTQNGEFTIVEDNDSGERLDATVALYPYADNLSIEKVSAEGSDVDEYEISGFVLPEKQTYCADSFGEGAFPMAALTDVNSHSFGFRNLLGAIKLQLVGTEVVKSIKIKGKNGERLSGAATITVYSGGLPPSVRISEENETYVTLDCGNGVQLDESKATTFIIAIPPITFRNGFIVQVYGTDGKITQELEATASNEIVRSSVLVMPIKQGEPIDLEQDYEGLEYICEIGTEDKRLYTVEQKVNGDLVTYTKYNEEISREHFSKDLNLEAIFGIPEIVYVDSESQLSAVNLAGSSRDGDRSTTRKVDGFTISTRTQNHYFRFDAAERVTVTTEYEILKYGNDELPYTRIEAIRYKSCESYINEAETNDDVIVNDVTLHFEVELRECNLETAQTRKYIVPVTYKRVYERKEYTVAENLSCASQFGTEDKRLYTVEQKVNGELVTYNNKEISREPFSKDLNLETIFSIPEIVYVDSESQLSAVNLAGSSRDGDRSTTRKVDGFTISTRTQNHYFRFDAAERVTVTTEYEILKYGNDELPYTRIEAIRYKSCESYINEAETNDDIFVNDVTLHFEVELRERNLETAQTRKYIVPVTYKRVYERKEHVEIE